MGSSIVLEVNNLKKVYGKTVAVDGISFNVGANEIVGLLGPNGAGKTTTISMILAILEPTAGQIMINGKDVAKERSEALGYTNFTAVYTIAAYIILVAVYRHAVRAGLIGRYSAESTGL